MRTKSRRDVLVATLGSEPQVITYTLDILIAEHPIDEVIIIHTDHPAINRNIDILCEEFDRTYPNVVLRPIPIINSYGRVKDFLTQEDLRGLLRTLYIEIRRVRQANRRVHMCISGGRKVMAVVAMSVAQLLFGPGSML